MGDKNRFVDELLDSALAHQRGAEPRPGLEARIFESVRAAASEDRTRGTGWKWWVALATAAVVVAFVAIYVSHRPQSPVAQTSQASKATPSTGSKEILTANSGTTSKAGTAPNVVGPKQVERRIRNSSRRVEAHHWPSQFPTPAPLTAEQKALVQYVRQTPPHVLAASLFKDQFPDRSVEIEPLRIAPLEIQPLSGVAILEEMH